MVVLLPIQNQTDLRLWPSKYITISPYTWAIISQVPIFLIISILIQYYISLFYCLKCFRKYKIMSELLNIMIVVNKLYYVPDSSPRGLYALA